MNFSEFELIHEVFSTEYVSPLQLDYLLAEGWRHFGRQFFRYNVGFFRDELRLVMPLRLNVSDFILSKSQRRIVNKNAGTNAVIRPAVIDDEKHALFRRHAARFEFGVPESIFTFLDADAAEKPCGTLEICVYLEEKLAAVSFFDVGETAISSIYAMFEPEHANRSLGIYTMLLEIEYARNTGKSLYYQGYAYEGESFYDYKKRFSATEFYDWKGNWELITGN